MVGVPANYGGFETLAENLVAFHEQTQSPHDLTVYCSGKAFEEHPERHGRARLRYVGLDANGVQSIPYDLVCLLDAARRGHDRMLLLGVSGAPVLPLLRLVSRARIITNVDGIEWKREKWGRFARAYLRFAEWMAVRASHVVIADNAAIADYLDSTYGCRAQVIAYGGDHALEADPDQAAAKSLPDSFALGLCRIEPENNVAMILEAFDGAARKLVFVGNWDKSAYGRALKEKYRGHPTIVIHDPVYDPAALKALRQRASLYVHGHAAGGTNPSLVEMMHFGIPVAAHGCSFNRHTTRGEALYFESAAQLRDILDSLSEEHGRAVGENMREIACRDYTWRHIGQAYFALFAG